MKRERMRLASHKHPLPLHNNSREKLIFINMGAVQWNMLLEAYLTA
jgi:hypothetical protein